MLPKSVDMAVFRSEMTTEKTNANANGRIHVRSKMRAKIKITSSSVGEILAHTQDLSDGGLFALAEGQSLPGVGEIVQVQVRGSFIDAPILEAEVIRANSEGVGLMFK